MIEVYTSHWKNKELADLECQPVGISRGTPRGNPGFRYRVLRELAPSRETFALQGREEFEQSYRAQLEALGAEAILADLKRICGGRPVVMLCWERLADPGEWCHRRMLAAWLHERAGITVPELKHGMLERQPDAPQQALFD